jgi:hypothetical protein
LFCFVFLTPSSRREMRVSRGYATVLFKMLLDIRGIGWSQGLVIHIKIIQGNTKMVLCEINSINISAKDVLCFEISTTSCHLISFPSWSSELSSCANCCSLGFSTEGLLHFDILRFIMSGKTVIPGSSKKTTGVGVAFCAFWMLVVLTNCCFLYFLY